MHARMQQLQASKFVCAEHLTLKVCLRCQHASRLDICHPFFTTPMQHGCEFTGTVDNLLLVCPQGTASQQ